MKSLKRRLFLNFVATAGLIWLFAVAWIFIGAKREVESVLDTRLQEAARMVSSLVSSSTLASRELHSSYLSEIPSYERQLSCQIWSLDGRLVARSSGAPESKLGDIRAGFSERLIDGETWRVYTIEDVAKGVRVQVGDRLGLREHLVAELIEGLLAPTLLIIPLLGFLIWASLDRGLKPLQAISRVEPAERRRHEPDGNRPRANRNSPGHCIAQRAVCESQAARRHEREFIAFAAHELRTPLAGLRTQAQISIAATERPVRESALRQILVAVDRSTRLVRQLLALAKLDSAREKVQLAEVNLGEVLQAVIEELPASDQNAGVTIDPELHRATLVANREWLHLAMRNLHENAVHHMPRHGLIRWSMATTSESVTISIEDEGPGIPTEEIPLVTSRFFRGRHKSALGSGLGLSIVEVALRANDAELHLSNRTDRPGLRADMVWRFRRDPSQARLKSERPLVATDQVWQQPLRAV